MAEVLAGRAALATVAAVATAAAARSPALRQVRHGRRVVEAGELPQAMPGLQAATPDLRVATPDLRAAMPGPRAAARVRRAYRICKTRRLARISHRLGRAVRRLHWGCLVPRRPIVLPPDHKGHPAVSTGPAETAVQAASVGRLRASRVLPPVVTDSPERATDPQSDRPAR